MIDEYYTVIKGKNKTSVSKVDENVIQYFFEILPKHLNKMTILDIGCGNGQCLEFLCKRGAKKLIGIDINENMLCLASDRIKKSGMDDKIHLVHADIKEIPIANCSVDLVVSTFSLMYFKDLKSITLEIQRVLKHGGEAYIATNVIEIIDEDLIGGLTGVNIPILIGFGNKKIRVKNLVQSRKQYLDAFANVGLTVKSSRYFEPMGVKVFPDYPHRNKIKLSKAVFCVTKAVESDLTSS